MNSQHIIFVPGKNPKPPPQDHINLLWRIMLEGVHRIHPATADDISTSRDRFHLIAWNYLYYQTTRNIEDDYPWIESFINKYEPTHEDKKQANSWLRKISRLLYLIADRFPFLIRLIPEQIKRTIEETNRYFKNEGNIGYQIRGQFKEVVRPLMDNEEPVLIIAHSLGSVIAYDALWELSHTETHKGKVDLLTIGSPLGLKFVQEKLQGRQFENKNRYPTNIRHWFNVSAVGDLTSLDQSFEDDFGEMMEYGMISSIEDYCEDVYNFFRGEDGLNCHRSYGYLVTPVVGRNIADWWKKNKYANLISK